MNLKLLEKGLIELGIKYSTDTISKFSLYLKELHEWNEKVNLTGIMDENEIIKKHFLDSLSCVLACHNFSGKSGIDVGTGAGFPGLPLKICFPDFKITLLDSSNKKIKFLEHIVNLLELSRVEILHGRAEDFARGSYREKYDIVLARAIAKLPILIEICLPFTKTGGILLAQKAELKEEINNSQKILELVAGKIKEIKEIKVPFLDAKRNIVIIEKEKPASIKYPRRPGIPQKRPIL